MQLALNESNDIPFNGKRFNVKEKMDPWTKLKHYPVIKVTQEQTNVSNHINIIIFLENVNAIDKMVGIPLTYTAAQRNSYFTKITRLWLSPTVNNLILQSLNNETFTIINTLQAGKYKQLSLLCLLIIKLTIGSA